MLCVDGVSDPSKGEKSTSLRVDGMSLAGSVPSQRGFGYVDPHRDVPGISASESRRPTTYPEVP